MPAHHAAACAAIDSQRQDGNPAEYEFTIPADMDDGIGRDLQRDLTYRLRIELVPGA
jgi:hypothetical protein